MLPLKKIQKMPKVDLHRHLEGAIRPETIHELSLRKKSKVKYELEHIRELMKVTGKEKTLMDFIYKLGTPFMLDQTFSKDDMVRFAYEACVDAVRDGIIYLELRCCPSNYYKTPLTAKEFFDGVYEGMRKAEEEYDIKTGLIIAIKREESDEINREILNLTIKYFKQGKVVGVDLCGNEPAYPTKDYEKYFKVLKKMRMPITIHAGESKNEEFIQSVIDAVDILHTDRVGHGTISIKSPKLLNKLKKEKILIEVCPTSNLHTKIIKKFRDQPASEFNKRGIQISINTDDPITSDITLSKEFYKLGRYQKFTKKDFNRIGMGSISHAFLNPKDKANLKAKFKRAFKRWEVQYGEEDVWSKVSKEN